MGIKKQIPKKLVNSHLLKNYGSWMYCDGCNSTVGYICYTTYEYFSFDFTCKCGTEGSFELGEKPETNLLESTEKELLLKKNRFCCSVDESPLFSVVDRNLIGYRYELVCKSCMTNYKSSVLAGT